MIQFQPHSPSREMSSRGIEMRLPAQRSCGVVDYRNDNGQEYFESWLTIVMYVGVQRVRLGLVEKRGQRDGRIGSDARDGFMLYIHSDVLTWGSKWQKWPFRIQV